MMVEVRTVAEISRMSIWFSGVFAIIGIALTYLYIAVSDASGPVKVLQSAGLSMGVAFAFLIIWLFARDFAVQRERELKRKQMP
jgi:uncharacterized membrane protein YedE/YeeE